MKIGLMGGSFDPIHFGHLFAAEEARTKVGLSKVIFIPSGSPPHKPAGSLSPAKERSEMAALAIRHNPHFELNEIELKSDEVSFTVRTIASIRDTLPSGSSLYLIMGADSLSEFGTWNDPEKIVNECTIIAVSRPGHELAVPPGTRGKGVVAVQCRGVDISSTEIRRRIRNGESARYLLPDDVLSYIMSHGLYR